MSLHNWLGDILIFILRITTNAPVFLKANTGFYRELSRFAAWDLSLQELPGKKCKQSLRQSLVCKCAFYALLKPMQLLAVYL